MADNEIFVGGQVDPKFLKDLGSIRDVVKAIDQAGRAGRISTDLWRSGLDQVQKVLPGLNSNLRQFNQIQGAIDQSSRHLETGFVSLSDSMRDVLTQQRLGNRLLGQATQAMNTLGLKGITPLLGQVDSLSNAFETLSTGLGLGAMGGVVGAGAGLVAGVMYLANYMDELAANAKKAREEIQNLKIASGEFGIGQSEEILRGRAEAAEAGIEPMGWLSRTLIAGGSKGKERLKKAEEDYLAPQLAAAEKAWEAYYDFIRKQYTQAAEDYYKAWSDAAARADKRTFVGPEYAGPAAGPTGAEIISAFGGAQPWGPPGTIGPGARVPSMRTNPIVGYGTAQFAKATDVGKKEINGLQTAFLSASSTIGNSISNEIGGAFASVFGGAHTLLGQFASEFASTFMQLGFKGLFGGLLGLASGKGFGTGFLGVLGLGGGPSESYAGGRGEAVGIAVAQALNGLKVTVSTGGDLVLAYDTAKVAQRGKIMNSR